MLLATKTKCVLTIGLTFQENLVGLYIVNIFTFFTFQCYKHFVRVLLELKLFGS